MQAERCLNHASERFITLGNEAGEAAVLRQLAAWYEQLGATGTAVCCLERALRIDAHYKLPDEAVDREHDSQLTGNPATADPDVPHST